MRCYYEILGVCPLVSDENLRKAYKKLALECHPDRHPPERAEEYTQKFTELQRAFDVVSNVQERAWYDSHRSALLRSAPNKQGSGFGSSYTPDSDLRRDIAQHIDVVPFTTISVFSDFSEDPAGFYAIYAKLFEDIFKEDSVYFSEAQWASMRGSSGASHHRPERIPAGELNAAHYPAFGRGDTPYADGPKAFYAFWESYITPKTFVWCESYDVRYAPNAHTRRHYKTENQRLREAAKAAYEQDVRTLVQFVKRRDPRVAQNKASLHDKNQLNIKRAQANAVKAAKEFYDELMSQVIETKPKGAWAEPDHENELLLLEKEFSNKLYTRKSKRSGS